MFRFNQDTDLTTITVEKLKQILTDQVRVVTPDLIEDPDIKAAVSLHASQIHKNIKLENFLSKKEEYDPDFQKTHLNKELAIKEENLKKNFQNEIITNKIRKANDILLQFEAVIFYQQQETEKQALIERREKCELDFLAKLISETEHNQLLNAIEDEDSLLATREMGQAQTMLEGLIAQRNSLLHSIEVHEANIRFARKIYGDEILKYVDDVEVGGIKTFEGMTDEEKRRFIKGYMEIEEVYLREQMELEKQLRETKERLMANNRQGELSGLTFTYNNHRIESHPDIQKIYKNMDNLKKAKIEKTKQLGDGCNHQHVNNKKSHAESDQHLNALKNTKPIAQNLRNFTDCANQNLRQIQVKQENADKLENVIDEQSQKVTQNGGNVYKKEETVSSNKFVTFQTAQAVSQNEQVLFKNKEVESQEKEKTFHKKESVSQKEESVSQKEELASQNQEEVLKKVAEMTEFSLSDLEDIDDELNFGDDTEFNEIEGESEIDLRNDKLTDLEVFKSPAKPKIG